MDLFNNKNFWVINCINQDLNSATNVKLAVIAEVTQGSKPVLGAKVCHQTWFNLVPNQSSKWCPKMKVGLPLPHYSKVVAEVERPQGAPISLILKVEPCRWQIHTIFSLLAISLILQIWHIWFWKQYFEPQVISFGDGISLGRCAENQNGNLRWHLPWRGGGGLEGVSFAIKLFWKMIFLKTI